MPTCCAINCYNKKIRGNGISFHKFPFSKPALLNKWVIATNKADWTPSRTSFLCSDHFPEELIDRTGQIIRLREGAVPSLFRFPHHLIKKQKSRTPPSLRCPTTVNSNLDTLEVASDVYPVVMVCADAFSKDIINGEDCSSEVIVGGDYTEIIVNGNTFPEFTANDRMSPELIVSDRFPPEIIDSDETDSEKIDPLYCTNFNEQLYPKSPSKLMRAVEDYSKRNKALKKDLKVAQQNIQRLRLKLNSLQTIVNLL